MGPQAAHDLSDGRQRCSADQRWRGTCASARLWATSERVPSQEGEVTGLMPQTHFMAEPRQDSRFLNHVPIHSTAQGALWDFSTISTGPSWPTVKEDGSADDGQCILSPGTPWKSPGPFTSLLVT